MIKTYGQVCNDCKNKNFAAPSSISEQSLSLSLTVGIYYNGNLRVSQVIFTHFQKILKKIRCGHSRLSLLLFRGVSEKITVPEESACYKSIDGVLFDKTGETLIYYPEKREGSVYEIPQGVKRIAPSAFSFSQRLTSVILPESSTETVMVFMYYQYSNNSMMGLASAISWVLAAIIFVITAIQFAYNRHKDKEVN